MSETNEKRPVDALHEKLDSELDATREVGEQLKSEKLVKRWDSKRQKPPKKGAGSVTSPAQSEKNKNKTNMLRNIVLGVLALVVLVAALYGVSRIRTPEEIEQEETAKKQTILTAKTSDVISVDVSIRDTGEKLSFYKDNSKRSEIEVKENVEKWFFKGYEDSNVDLSKVKDLVSFAANVRSERILKEGVSASDLGEYGLDNPSAKLNAKYADGSTLTILLGNEINDGTSAPPSYFMIDGGDTVYAGKSSYRFYMLHDSAFYISTQTIEFDGSEFSYLHYTKRDGTEVILSVEERDETNLRAYRMTAPFAMGLDLDVMGSLQSELSALQASSIAEANAKAISKYGLLDPAATIEMRSQLGQEYKLYIGDPAPEEDGLFTYMMIEGDDNVYLMYTSTLAFLDREPEHMIDGYVLSMKIEDVDAVEFWYKGTEHKMNIEREKNGDTVKETFFLDGGEVADTDFRAIYAQVISMTLDGPAVKEFDKDADALLVVTMVRSGGLAPITMEFIPYDLDRYALRDASGNAGFVMLRDDPDKVITMIDRVKQGLPAREYDGNRVIIGEDDSDE